MAALRPTRWTPAPANAEANRSNVDRSKISGASCATRSSAVSANSPAAQAANAIALRCDTITPLGDPVDPDV